jgi:hypothetical protein
MAEKNLNLSQTDDTEQQSDASKPDIDLQELANYIFEKLHHELEIENERLGLSK